MNYASLNQRLQEYRCLGSRRAMAGWRFERFVALCLLAAAPGSVLGQGLPVECGTLERPLGPFDYNDPAATERREGAGSSMLQTVETNHFNSDVEFLIRGMSSANVLDDLEFTLRSFPNHHRALQSVSNYFLRNDMSRSGRMSIDCWFLRALYFRPEDAVVPLIYGIYLARKGDYKAAEQRYLEALTLQESLVEAHYNIGLLYTEQKAYDQALVHAERAYALGHPLPGLRNRLERAGVWKEPGNKEQ